MARFFLKFAFSYAHVQPYLELKTLPLCLGLELKEAAYCYINAFIVSLSDLLLIIYLNSLDNHLYFFVPMVYTMGQPSSPLIPGD